MTGMKNRIAAVLATALALSLAAPAQAAGAPTEPIRVSGYKGSTLAVGERGGLMIYPGVAEYAVTSSDPDVIAVERVMSFWVAVARAEGTAEITAVNRAGARGTLTLTVGPAPASAAPADPAAPTISVGGNSGGRTDNLEIRQEIIRLVNETRVANGVPELPVSEALMNAAQVCSDRRYTWHHSKEECEAAATAGYPYGFGSNITVFTGTDNAAQHAVDNWINSPGHFQTMIDPRCDCIGVGLTQHDGVTYCFLFLGIPNSVNFYA